MSGIQAWLLALFSMVCFAGCRVVAPERAWRGETIQVPDEALVYSTDARSDAAVFGAEVLDARVRGALVKRGDKAVADGALTATACWVLNEANRGRPLGTVATDAASRHFGFSGVVVWIAAYDSQHAGDSAGAIARLPENVPVNRYGICSSPTGQTTAAVFGNVELSLEPISRFSEPPATIHLKGEVADRFASAHVYLTKTDGTVEDELMPSRKLEYSKTLSTPGRYKLEVMGIGPMGPVVISNLPLYVGAMESSLQSTAIERFSPAEAEARMLELLNAARAAAGLRPVLTDNELREVALGHSNDMDDHKFFAHVSPTTGTPADRVRRSGALVAEAAENIAKAESPQAAHDGLMESPGHRAAMLWPRYTHVGIAAVDSDNSLLVTMVFGRRVDPAKLPRDAGQVETALLALRAQKGLSKPKVDPLYRTAAQRGVQAFLNASKPTAEIASQATVDAIRSETIRLRVSRPASCAFFAELLDADQLEQVASVLDPGLVKFGVGAQVRTDGKGSRLTTMIVLEGVRCAGP